MMMPRRLDVQLPDKLAFLMEPRRYKVAYGGRGGCKTYSFALAILLHMIKRPLLVVAARNYYTTIQDSAHRIFRQLITTYKLQHEFEVQKYRIYSANGGEIMFRGLATHIEEIKSLQGVNICWVDEAEGIADDMWRTLPATIRDPGSEIWVSFNPKSAKSSTYRRFIANPPSTGTTVKIGWEDNPWISPELLAEKDYDYAIDPEAARWVWGGEPRYISKAAVLADKYVVDAIARPLDEAQAEAAGWSPPMYGADWGFAVDPTVLIRCYERMVEGKRELYIDQEAYHINLPTEQIPKKFFHVPGSQRHVLRADNARPEIIHHLTTHGYPKAVACAKWPGSVEDGISYIRGYSRVVIHPRCKHTADEFSLYSYRVAQNGDILPHLVDKHNHCIDALRYALEPQIRSAPKREPATWVW
jgi:phage terminase large subunit